MTASTTATRHDRAALAGVTVVACGAAIWLLRRYLAHWQQLWTDLIHDRSAHLDFGVQLAGDLRTLRVVDLLRDVNSFRTWPPLHDGVMVGAVSLASGLDPRAGVLPSLAAYVATAVLAFVVARRLVPRRGNTAGALAAALVLVSPAFRAFATDVMIEGPGACLVLLVLYAAVRVRQQPSTAAWRFLALALSALFLTKYNYWLLATAACLPAAWPLRGRFHASALPRAPRWTIRVGVVALLVVAAAQGFLGSTAIATAMVAAWMMTATTVWWAVTSGAELVRSEPAVRMLLRWHVLPALVWLCLPGKLQAFLWYQWPFTNSGESPSVNPLRGVTYYAAAAAHDYHTSTWIAVVVAVMIVIAVIAHRAGRLRRGAGIVLLLVAVALLTTVPHPNRKSRFLHPMMPAVWVVAGAGLVTLADSVVRRRAWPVGLLAASLVATQVTGLAAAAHAPEGGVQPARPTALALTDAYLPELATGRAPAIISNVPFRFLARWTYQVRYDRAIRPVTEVPGLDPAHATPANAVSLERWLSTGVIDALVLVDVTPSSPWFVHAPLTDGLTQLPDLVRAQHVLVESWHEDLDGARIEVWVRP